MKYFIIILLLSINLTGKNLFTENLTYIGKTEKQNLDSIISDKQLGVILESDKTTFRIFAPNAEKVELHLFKKVDDENGQIFVCNKFDDGVWEVSVNENLNKHFYGYKVYHEKIKDPALSIDPYSKAVATYNTYMNPRKSIIYEEEYNWEGDTWIQRDWRDIIVYEMHIRDMTIHKTSGVESRGSYKGLTELNKKGGLSYIKELGVNTVELLPAQEFGCVEIPYMDSMSGKFNTWNPYERNHWGYMTAAYFAPEAYYSTGWEELKRNEWMGFDGKQVNDFKDMVKAFHNEGIAVIMDVVYNHLSEYELGNLKQIDKNYYFRLDKNGNYIAESFCGNDLKTERPMMRRLIVESVLFWMKEYHIDGFRFDLGKLIDWQTIEEIIHEARKINPSVVFVCEPWGGGYDPQGFSLRDWGAWNDQIRNGIKGENPFDGKGWIFGKWYGNNNIERIKSYVKGTLISDKNGLFIKPEHSVNYLAAHDGYTLGDFIRLGLGDVGKEEVILSAEVNTKLTEKQMKLNKLGAMFLLSSQGITMLHFGQEFARSKVIPKDIDVADRHKGMIDHNSYEKDNETNYINYELAEINRELIEYYKGLIEIRNKYKAFRRANPDEIKFYEVKNNEFALGWKLHYENEEFIVLTNANIKDKALFELPLGDWSIIANGEKAGIETIDRVSGKITLSPSTGYILRKN